MVIKTEEYTEQGKQEVQYCTETSSTSDWKQWDRMTIHRN